MFKTMGAAALLIGFCSAASAAPVAPSAIGTAAGEQSSVIQVAKQGKKRHHWDRGRHHGRQHHWRRHHGPPPGWRRYDARPWDWRTRGCAMIGPVWFCP
jgi:hypothetical protein